LHISRGSRLDKTLAVPVGKRDGNGEIDKTYPKDKNAPVQSIFVGHPGLCPKLLFLRVGKNQNPDLGNVMCGPDGLLPSLDNTVQDRVSGGKKWKTEVMAESSRKKFVFNKRGKLKDDELIEHGDG
jgi:hypothetical protein